MVALVAEVPACRRGWAWFGVRGRYAGCVSPEQYPEDEFDEAGRDVTVGVHRRKPSQWKSVLPFVLVLILAPLLAWGAATLYVNSGSGGSESESDTSPSASASAAASPASTEAAAGSDETAAPSDPATEEPSASPSESAATGDKDATILILNGTGTNGLAGGVADKLRQDGYQNVNAENAEGWLSEVTVLYYQPGKEALAKHVGQLLGVSKLEENGDVVGNNAVIVLLRGDYKH